MTPEEYKKLSIKEFTQAAKIYDSGHAGIYEMCKHDYPPILAELEKEDFHDVLDCGCGTGPMLELLHQKYPGKHYVGLDLTPEMIHVAQAKQLSNTEFLIGDSENLPFAEGSFDAIICANSFHHYPNPQDFFNSAYRVLRKGGRLILRDYTSSNVIVWLMNHLEMPLANLVGHGDVNSQTGRIHRDGRKSRIYGIENGKAERFPRASGCTETMRKTPVRCNHLLQAFYLREQRVKVRSCTRP